MYIFILTAITGIFLGAYSIYDYNFNDEPKNMVLFEKAKTESESEKLASIDKVELFSEECDKVIFKVSYTFNNSYDGFIRLHTSSMGLGQESRGSHMETLTKGTSTAKHEQWITKESKEVTTKELWVTLEKVLNKTYDGHADRVKIPYDKIWNHSCK
jgi:hypothetical protein